MITSKITPNTIKDSAENREPLLITQSDEAKLVVMDTQSFEGQEQTLALLKILALGSRQIEQDKFRDVEKVFAELDSGL